MAPRDEHEFLDMLELALGLTGPVAIRYPRGPISGRERIKGLALEAGRAEILRKGPDLAIVAMGQPVWAAMEAAGNLAARGFEATVINARFIKPIDRKALETAAGTGRILTVEENSLCGGLYGAVCEVVCGLDLTGPVKIRGLGFTDSPVHQANQTQQRALLGLDKTGLELAALELLQKNT
jgi:1-deoxy-D-xylulose-5-phosphate synthase